MLPVTRDTLFRSATCHLSPVICHHKGMTLVEMLLAVTLFSTMMGAAGGLVQFGLRSQALWGAAAASALRMERAMQTLERDLTAAQPLFGIPVLGSKNELAFARVEAVSTGGEPATPEWVRVSYQLAEASGQLSLVREMRAWRLGTSGDPLTREVLLAVTDAALAYGRLDAEGQLVWVEAWDGASDGLPRLVKLDVAVLAPSGGSIRLARVFRNPAGNLPMEEGP